LTTSPKRSLFKSPAESSEEENPPLSRSFIGGEPSEPKPTIEYGAFDFETTDTGSFETAPELSEPTQRLFESLLKSPRTDKKKQPMSGPFGKKTEDKPKADDYERPMLIKLNDPKPFTGKREELQKFLQDTGLYLAVNDQIYNNDIKKITFVLSFVNEGDAASWKEEFLEEKAKQEGPIDLGTYKDFVKTFKEAFQPFDAPGDALEEIKTIRMGTNSAEDHVAQFKMLVTKANLKESSMLIDAFRETLKIPLQRQILNLETAPADLKGWYDAAIKLDNKYRRIQRIIGRSNDQKNDKGKKTEEPKRRWNFQTKKDPNAMDIDVLTAEQREEHMKKGLCFKCHKPGHRGNECPDKGGPSTRTPPAYTPKTTSTSIPPTPAKKMTPKEIYAHIRSLTTQMNEDEKEQLDKLAEEEGF
jgi:hypothetical protein